MFFVLTLWAFILPAERKERALLMLSIWEGVQGYELWWTVDQRNNKVLSISQKTGVKERERKKTKSLSLPIKHILSLQVNPALLCSFWEGRKAEPVLSFSTKFRYANGLKGYTIEKGCYIASKPHTLKLNKIRKIESFRKLWAECKLVNILMLWGRWPTQPVYKHTVWRTNETKVCNCTLAHLNEIIPLCFSTWKMHLFSRFASDALVGFWPQIALNMLSGILLSCLPGQDFVSFPKPPVEGILSFFPSFFKKSDCITQLCFFFLHQHFLYIFCHSCWLTKVHNGHFIKHF